jgi:hypothetical protein
MAAGCCAGDRVAAPVATELVDLERQSALRLAPKKKGPQKSAFVLIFLRPAGTNPPKPMNARAFSPGNRLDSFGR